MFKQDNKVICIEDSAWVKKGCKGIVIQEGDSENSPYVLWESNGTGNKNIKLYVKAKYLQLLEEPKSESLKPEDLIPGEWYKIVSTGSTKNWIFKFHSLVNSNIKTILSTAIGSGSYNGLGTWGNISDIVNIEKATKEEVLKYYPDEFKSKEPEENLVGRYIKALVFAPDGGKVKKDEIGLIKEVFGNNVAVDFPSHKGYYASFKRKSSYELMPVGFNPELKEQYSFYVKYEPDFTEDIFNKFVEWCKNNLSSKRTWRTFTDNTYNSFKDKKYFFIDFPFSGELNQSFGVDNNKQYAKKQLSLQELKDLIGYKEEHINTYGLSVGDVLPGNVINAWCKKDKNLLIKTRWNQVTADYWSGENKTISFFELKDNIITIFFEENSDVHGIKAEGFKEFMENFDKPKVEDKFIVGKWYKAGGDCYIKYTSTEKQPDYNKVYGETISYANGKYAEIVNKPVQEFKAFWEFKEFSNKSIDVTPDSLPIVKRQKTPKILDLELVKEKQTINLPIIKKQIIKN